MGRWVRPEQPKKTIADTRVPSDKNNSKGFHGKPPRKENVKIQQVPTWERNFCYKNGVSWTKLLSEKRFIDQYPKIMNWNDSAVKEAFQDAKARYWAHIRGYKALPLPRDNKFIDEVDFDAPPSDPTLYENLRGSISDDEYDEEDEEVDSWGEGGVILLDEHYFKVRRFLEFPDDHVVTATGWE